MDKFYIFPAAFVKIGCWRFIVCATTTEKQSICYVSWHFRRQPPPFLFNCCLSRTMVKKLSLYSHNDVLS